jgi:outer membrane protein W
MGIRFRTGWLSPCAVAAAATLAVNAVAAADYPTKKSPPPAPAPVVVTPVSPGFFVKAGLLYGINQTSSKLYSQGFPGGALGGPQALIPGVGATVSNVFTVGFEAGYFVTPNVSVDVSAGVPMWATDKTKGTLQGFPLPSGTLLVKIMPSFVPVTALYHFTQFGAFQPYIGGGVAAVFSFAKRDAFDTGVDVKPTVGLVLQGGADVMIDQHWGWSVDVRKLFAHVTADATGENFGPYGAYPIANSQKAYFQPWVLSTGVTYRF